MLSRRNHTYSLRRAGPKLRFFNILQPLGSLFAAPVLCFQHLAASFPKTPGVGRASSRLSFGISNIQPLFSRHVCNLVTIKPSLAALCFHNDTSCFPRNPFLFTTIQIARGCTPKPTRATKISGAPAFRIQSVCSASALSRKATRLPCGFSEQSREVYR